MIPQELVEAIVDEVRDKESLKACALVSSSFLSPSQRNLFRRLTLGSLSHGTGALAGNPQEWCHRLTESPHIVPHVSALTIYLKKVFIDGAPGLEELLDKLDNVRRCTIRGSSTHTWKDMITVTQPLLKFIQRQRFSELHLLFIMELPRPTLAFLLSSAARSSFYYVTIDPQPTDTVNPPSRTRNPKYVLLARGVDMILDILASPEFSPHVANLRQLGLDPCHGEKYNAVLTSCTMLERRRFICFLGSKAVVLPLPPHPTLRSVDIMISPGQDVSLIQSITALLASASATLEEISVSFTRRQGSSFPPLQPQTLAALSTILPGNRTDLPCIRLRIDVESGAQALRDFIPLMQLALPAWHAQVKLIVEQYSYANEIPGDWSFY